MLKSELIERIAEQNPHLYQRDVEKIVNTILDTRRNPRNGQVVAVAEKLIPMFKTSKDMHHRLNPKRTDAP